MLSHHKAIVFIQIKHGVFDCKVHKQKRHVKVGSFRMVTERMQTISPHRSIIATQIIPTQNRHDVPPRGG